LQLEGVAMIAADTSRSKAYVQALVRHQLLPQHVLVLQTGRARPLPGQLIEAAKVTVQNKIVSSVDCWSEAAFDSSEPLAATLQRSSISSQFVYCDDINDAQIVKIVAERPESVFIYSGYGGVLLRNEILATGKRFLHVHGGYLPDYKGSTTNYFSLIAEDALGASSLFLTADIDGGPVLLRRRFPPPIDRTAIDHVYDSAARARVLVDTLSTYMQDREWRFDLPQNSGGDTYYIIHPVLKHVAILSSCRANSTCE
jgi:methionyl-tRNA formyltransferase